MPNKKEVSKKSLQNIREQLLSKKEVMFFVYYFIAGIVLGLILMIFNVTFQTTISKFYGFLYMFFIPGLFIFRAVFKYKIFNTVWEEYGYPVIISWVLHSLLISSISGFFKTAITDLNLYGTSFIITLIFVGVFYFRKAK